jgi:ribosomal protein S18 acetylase RimI-like enzyme
MGESYCLASSDSPPCGFGQHWVETDGCVHLGRIIVAPIARGQGVGRELCRQLIARAIQVTGAAIVTLRVYRDNPKALGLYLSLGFSPIESESDLEVLFMSRQANPSLERDQA